MKKKPKGCQDLCSFDAITIGEEEKAEKAIFELKKQIRIFMRREDISQLLHGAHIAFGHGNRNCLEYYIVYRKILMDSNMNENFLKLPT